LGNDKYKDVNTFGEQISWCKMSVIDLNLRFDYFGKERKVCGPTGV